MRHPLTGALTLALTGACLAQASAYVPIPAAPSPTSRWVWDSTRARIVAVDAASGLWEWDGSRWEPRLGVGGGSGIAFYDPYRRAVIAWGAAWDGARWLGGGVAALPAASSVFGFAFDLARRRLVAPASGTVHEWDGATWHAIPAPNGPTSGGAFVHDPVHQRSVLYGGGTGAECWSWDGSAWTLLANAAPPGPRTGAVLALEPTTARLVLYGGTGNTTTWTLQGATFAQVATTRDPGERLGPQLVFDGQGLLLGGGSMWRGGELWRFANNDWTELPGGAPRPRYQPGLAWDPLRGETVVYGGAVGPSSTQGFFDDTWVFDRRWRRHAGTGPSPRWAPQLAWSAIDGAVLLHGNDTWLWDGSGWTQRQPATTPPWRLEATLVPDPAGGVLLFGGRSFANTVLGDHWLWNGTDWTQLAPSPAPAARLLHLAAHDPARNVVVLAGGYDGGQVFQETWEWNGAVWTLAGGLPFPGISTPNNRMAFNPATGRVRAEVTGQYEWDGVTWTTIATGIYGAPAASYAADLARGRLLRYTHFELGLAALTRTPAVAERFGNGCAIGPAPGLTTIGRPVPGAAQLALAAMTYAPNAPAFVVLGLQAQNQPLGSGCSALVGTVLGVHFLVADASAHVSLPLPIPPTPDLRGVSFTAQIAVVDAARGLHLGLTLSEGLRVAIGD